MISSTAQQLSSATVKPVCTTNAQSEEGLIPDLNIAHIPEEEAPVAAFDINQAQEDEQPLESASAQSWLPDDWIVECRPRKDGTKDKQYFIESFTGRRFRSKLEVQRYLETGVVPRYKKKSKTKHESEAGLEQCFEISNSEPRRPFPPVEQTFIPTNSSATNSSTLSGEQTYRGLELPSSSASFDNLRSMIMNGFTSAAASFSQQPRSYENSKPVFSDTWTSMLGAGSSLASVPRSSWTNTFLNGSSTSSTGGSSTTPHWLDRILNKPPPAGIPQPGYSSSSYGLSGNFVQSPLHYLHNAGAFENSWLNLKPPSTIEHEVPWKSRSWFDKKEPARTPQTADLLERHGLNLNHPVPDPEMETYSANHRSRDSSYYGGGGGGGGAPSAPSSHLDSLWKKGIPISLEQREYVPYSNGGRSNRFTTEQQPQQAQQQQQSQQHQQQQQQQQQQQHQNHYQQQQQQQHKIDGGVRRGSSKVDRHMEKKRLERLGATLCQRELAKLFEELNDRSKLNLNLNRVTSKTD